MILPFSTKLNDKPTYFVEKILTGLLHSGLVAEPDFDSICPSWVIVRTNDIKYRIDFDHTIIHKPKLHTIREDKNNRWKVGNRIDFYINARQKNMYRFAPYLPVVRVQNIEIKYVPFGNNKQAARPFVKVDGRLIYDVGQTLWSQMKEFAENDGFDSVNDFFAYFNNDYTGKIIHWTDMKY